MRKKFINYSVGSLLVIGAASGFGSITKLNHSPISLTRRLEMLLRS